MEFIIDYMARYGLLGLFGGLIIEALGVPFPGGALLMLSGFLVNQDLIDLHSLFGVAVLGFNIGAMLAFYVGHRMGNLFFQCSWVRSRGLALERARSWLDNNAPVYIIAGRFVPMMGNILPYLAGAIKIKWYRFLFYNFIFTIVWVSFNVSVGLLFGYKWPQIAAHFQDYMPLLVVAIILIYLVAKYVLKLLYGLKGEKI